MILRFLQSSIGKKWIVALTGIALVGFVTGHLVGNLQMFLPPDWINAYALKLEHLGPLLWVIRISLLTIFVLHIVTTISLVIQNRKARPDRYAVTARQYSTTASRTMAISGLLVLAFVIYHLLHFTVRVTHPEYNQMMTTLHGEPVRDVHLMVIAGFKNPLITGFYLLSIFLLSMHLSHGFSSFFQTLSLNTRKTQGLLTCVGRLVSWGIFAGYASIPLGVLTGIIHR